MYSFYFQVSRIAVFPENMSKSWTQCQIYMYGIAKIFLVYTWQLPHHLPKSIKSKNTGNYLILMIEWVPNGVGGECWPCNPSISGSNPSASNLKSCLFGWKFMDSQKTHQVFAQMAKWWEETSVHNTIWTLVHNQTNQRNANFQHSPLITSKMVAIFTSK